MLSVGGFIIMFDYAGDLYAVVRVISSGKNQQVGNVAHRIQGLIAALSSSDVVLLIQSTCRLDYLCL